MPKNGFINDVILRDQHVKNSYFKLIHNKYIRFSQYENMEFGIKSVDQKISQRINLSEDERRLVLSSLEFNLEFSPDKIESRVDVLGDGYCCVRCFFVCCYHRVNKWPLRDPKFNIPEEASAFLSFLEHLRDVTIEYSRTPLFILK